MNDTISIAGFIAATIVLIDWACRWYRFNHASFTAFMAAIVALSLAWTAHGFMHWAWIIVLVLELLMTIGELIPDKELR